MRETQQSSEGPGPVSVIRRAERLPGGHTGFSSRKKGNIMLTDLKIRGTEFVHVALRCCY